MNTEMSASAISRCSLVHVCPSARRHSACGRGWVGGVRGGASPPAGDRSYLSEGHGDGLGDAGDGSALGVVLQEDAVALEDHVRLPVDHQGSLGWREPHGVLELTAVRRHLGEERSPERQVGRVCPSRVCVCECVWTLSPLKLSGRTQ